MTIEKTKIAQPAGAAPQKVHNRVKEDKGSVAFKIVAYVLLILGLFLVLVPFWVILSTSFQERNILEFTWWPERTAADAYELVLTSERSNILMGFVNTMWIVVPSMLVGLFVSGLASFAYAKLRFRAKKWMFAVTIATMSIPGTVLMMPSFLWYNILGWAQGPLPLIIPGCFGGAATVFFFTQYFSGIPQSLLEAGQIDGKAFFVWPQGEGAYDWYYGDWVGQKRIGQGFYQFNNGCYYHGEFAEDWINGEGTFHWTGGNYWTGTFVGGNPKTGSYGLGQMDGVQGYIAIGEDGAWSWYNGTLDDGTEVVDGQVVSE